MRVDSTRRFDLLVSQLERTVVAIAHRLAIVGLRDLYNTYGGRSVFGGHSWEGTEGEMKTVWRKMMREKGKRDRHRRWQ